MKKMKSPENQRIFNLTCAWRVNQITVWRVNTECVESVSMKKKISCENMKILNLCLESVNQISVWRVNPECVESVSMKKMISRENLKILNLTYAWRV